MTDCDIKRNNGLKLYSIFTASVSQSVSKEEVEKYLISSVLKDGYIVGYLDNKIATGVYEKGELKDVDGKVIPIEYAKQIRIFNKNQEILINRQQGGSYLIRNRRDATNESAEFKKTFVVDAHQALWGTKRSEHNGYIEISENQVSPIVIPKAGINIPVPAENNAQPLCFIKTRNYVRFDGGQAGYVDFRFVDFVSKEDLPQEVKNC